MRLSSFAIIGLISTALAGCGAGGSSVPTQTDGLSTNNVSSSSSDSDTISAHKRRVVKKKLKATVLDPYSALVASDSPLAYYRLNDTGLTLTDSGPNALTGAYGANVAHGGPVLTSTQDPSAILPGSPVGSDIPSNTASVPANALFATATTAVTIEAWVKMPAYNATNNYMPIVSYGRGGIGNVWALQLTPQSSLDFYFKVTGGTATSYELKPGTARLSPGQIYQVAATFNGTTANLYLNGNLMDSVPATGTLNYASTFPTYGLDIGGEENTTRPIFNGDITDVSIYTTALPAAEIQKHSLVGQIVQPVTETPADSDAFVDSIGVVTHLRSTGTAYYTSWSTFLSLIEASGIRHIGDAFISSPSFYPQELSTLAAAGIHASLITDLSQPAATITSTMPAFQGAIEAIEGPNEPDLSGDPSWVADTQAYQQMLYSTIKSNPSTAGLTVVGPSVTSENADTSLGNLSSYMDEGSIHDYFSGYNPGTTGWGSLDQYGIYGSISWSQNIEAIVSGTKPEISTETGYSNLPSNGGSVDSQTLARYAPRTYLEHYLHGIHRTTMYEFYDEPNTGNFSNFGLVGATNTPKSSYYAIQSLIGLLADPGSVFTTSPCSYVLTGNMSNVQHLLMQKRNGTYELALWVETESYDPVNKVDIAVPAQTVTLQPTTLPSTSSIATIGDSGSVTTGSVSFPNGIATLTIDDHVTIVSFK